MTLETGTVAVPGAGEALDELQGTTEGTAPRRPREAQARPERRGRKAVVVGAGIGGLARRRRARRQRAGRALRVRAGLSLRRTGARRRGRAGTRPRRTR